MDTSYGWTAAMTPRDTVGYVGDQYTVAVKKESLTVGYLLRCIRWASMAYTFHTIL